MKEVLPGYQDRVRPGDRPEERPLSAAEHEVLRLDVEQAKDGDAEAAEGAVQPGDHGQPLRGDGEVNNEWCREFQGRDINAWESGAREFITRNSYETTSHFTFLCITACGPQGVSQGKKWHR